MAGEAGPDSTFDGPDRPGRRVVGGLRQRRAHLSPRSWPAAPQRVGVRFGPGLGLVNELGTWRSPALTREAHAGPRNDHESAQASHLACDHGGDTIDVTTTTLKRLGALAPSQRPSPSAPAFRRLRPLRAPLPRGAAALRPGLRPAQWQRDPPGGAECDLPAPLYNRPGSRRSASSTPISRSTTRPMARAPGSRRSPSRPWTSAPRMRR